MITIIKAPASKTFNNHFNVSVDSLADAVMFIKTHVREKSQEFYIEQSKTQLSKEFYLLIDIHAGMGSTYLIIYL